MSSSTPEGNGAGSAVAGSASALFSHTVRRDGRVIATLEGHQAADAGVTVHSQVFPITQPPDGPGMMRPFTFATAEQARRFMDEAMVAFEYLNCTIT